MLRLVGQDIFVSANQLAILTCQGNISHVYWLSYASEISVKEYRAIGALFFKVSKMMDAHK